MRLQSATAVSNLYGNAIDGNDAADVKLQHIVTSKCFYSTDHFIKAVSHNPCAIKM
jgi:hypothetical protein